MVLLECDLQKIVVRLFDIGAVKFGDFKMKIGVNSPVYFDLRVIVSYPKLLTEISAMLAKLGENIIKEADHICGVPYAALSIATMVAVKSERSLLVRRKEAKGHGTKKMVEGVYSQGDTCVIVEDVVTSGLSIVETVQDLKREGLKSVDAIVLLDREQGGTESLKDYGINVLSAITLTQVLQFLKEAGKLDQPTINRVKDYISKNHVYLPQSLLKPAKELESVPLDLVNRLKMRFEARAEKAENAMSAQLLNLMAEKRTTLCVAADVDECATLLDIASQVGPYICILKTHIDILKDFTPDFVNSLKKLSKQHNFMIMEDRKYADIGNTVRLQYTGGLYSCSSWADLVTSHSTPGKGIIDGLKKALECTDVNVKATERACFLVVEMSSEGALTSAQYRAESIKMAESRADFVAGVVSQSALGISSPGLVQLTPGVQLSSGSEDASAAGDGLGQQYNSPEQVVLERGADIAVVGRGIIRSLNVADTARSYRDFLWAAYEKRVQA